MARTPARPDGATLKPPAKAGGFFCRQLVMAANLRLAASSVGRGLSPYGLPASLARLGSRNQLTPKGARGRGVPTPHTPHPPPHTPHPTPQTRGLTLT